MSALARSRVEEISRGVPIATVYAPIAGAEAQRAFEDDLKAVLAELDQAERNLDEALTDLEMV